MPRRVQSTKPYSRVRVLIDAKKLLITGLPTEVGVASEVPGATEGQTWRTGRPGCARPGKVGEEGHSGQARAQGQKGCPRAGSRRAAHWHTKTAQVVAMLQRKGGATLAEIMDKMGWQRHTVRGFVAGAMKKAGYSVESFKPEGGDRTYRINQ